MTDENYDKHCELVYLLTESFERCGASLGTGPNDDMDTDAPDFLIGFAGSNEIARVISPWKPYTPEHAEWDANWNGHISFIRSTADVLPVLEKMAKRNWGKVK